MPADVFRIQGVVEVVADRAQRTLVVFRNAAAQTASSIKNNFAGLDKVLGGFSGFFTGLQFKRLADGMLQASIKSETFRTQMGLIVKDMTKVQDLTNYIEKYEARTPFDLPELQKATVMFTKLTKVRDESVDKVKDYLRTAGEMSALFDKPLQKAVEGLFKTYSGSALGLTILRNNFAITKAELEKFGVAFDKSGRIKNFQLQIGTIETAINKIIGSLSGFKLAEARSQTLFGRMETLASEVYRTARAFGDAMAPAAMLIIDRLISLNQAAQNLDPTTKSLIAGFVGLAAVAGTLVMTLGPIFYFSNQLIGSFRMLATNMSLAAAAGTQLTASTLLWKLGLTPIPALLRSVYTSLQAMWVARGLLSFGDISKGVSSLFTTTSMLRFGLYGVAAAALVAAANMNALTQARLKDIEARDQQLSETDPSRYRGGRKGGIEDGGLTAPVGRIEEIGTGKKPKPYVNYGPDNYRALEAEKARIEKELSIHPEIKAIADEGVTSKGLEERIKQNKAAMAVGRSGNKVDANTSLLGQAASWWDTGSFQSQAEIEAQRAQEAQALLDREANRRKAKATGQVQYEYKGKTAVPINNDQPAATEAELKKAQEIVKNYQEARGLSGESLKKLERETTYLEKILPMLKDREKLYETKMNPADIIGEVSGMDSSGRVGEENIKESMQRLHELKLKTLDKEGKVSAEYEEANYKVRKAMYDRTSKLSDQYVNKLKDQQAEEESQGEISLDRKMEFLVLQHQAMEKAAEEGSGAMTKAMLKQDREVQREWNKLATEKRKTNEALEIDITRITRGEAAARLMEIQKEYDARKLAGADEAKLRIWWDDQVRKNALANNALELEAARALTDARMEAANIRAGTRASKAGYDLEHGKGSFGDIRDANANMDSLAEQAAKIKMDREIDAAQKADAARDKGVASTLAKQIAAIKERYAAEAAARQEDQRQRDADIDAREAKKKSDEQIGQGEINKNAYDFQLEDLYNQQEGGADVNSDIQRVLRDRYQNEVALIRAKAEAAKVGQDAATQRQIEMQATQDILKTTRDMTAEMAKQIAMKKAAEDKKKNTSFFTTGPMSAEQYDELQKQRDAESRSRYQQMVDKERRRSGGVNKDVRDAANKLGVPDEVQNQVFNPVKVEVKPIEIDLNLNLTTPDGKTTTIRRQTSTDQKNEDTKTPQSGRGGPPPAPRKDNHERTHRNTMGG